ncbi:MAG: DUF111 family protein [Lachnospiraceae bacterium]|jgi:uncharacterized protein (DUF111 family)|nr:DUF111 family protein [Lachnospiraceae bacterium]
MNQTAWTDTDPHGKTLYLECTSGISGDMTVAALLDLGADEAVLRSGLASLHVDGFSVEVSRVKKSGLDACDFRVVLDAAHENHDHDMGYLHGAGHEDGAGHGHGAEHSHDEGHDRGLGHSHEAEHGHGAEHTHEEGHGHNAEHDHGSEHTHGDGHNHEAEHDHGAEHTHGDGHNHDTEHGHGAEHTLGAEHTHDAAHGHVHRGPVEIARIIDGSSISGHAKEIAKGIFDVIARAEAKAHGVPVEQVHFHEVGAVDSIADIVAVAICVDDLGIEDVIVEELYEGRGYIRCQHGLIPVPAPAVAHIVQAHGIPLHLTQVQGELVTPTGAAIVAALRTKGHLPERFGIVKCGLGAGKRKYELPGVLRAMLVAPVAAPQASCISKSGAGDRCVVDGDRPVGDGMVEGMYGDAVTGEMGVVHPIGDGMMGETETCHHDIIWKLETDIDDCSPEALGYCMERLLASGAKDAHYTPIFMKKGRPAYRLTVICDEAGIPPMERVIFAHTTTIGIRRARMERTVLPRMSELIETTLGPVRVKRCLVSDEGEATSGKDGEIPGKGGEIPGGGPGDGAAPSGKPRYRYYPEHESLKAVCEAHGMGYQDVYRAVLREIDARQH